MTTKMVQATSTAAVANGSKAKDVEGKAEGTANGTAADGPAPEAPENGANGTAAAATDGDANAKADGTDEAANKEAEALRKKEDEVAARGAEIAGLRALLCRAFSKPAEEPARPRSTWTFLLEEMSWLAADFNQERLWKRTAALAIAYEVAKKKGDFGLKQPPKEWRMYSDEVRELRAAAAGGGAAPAPAPAPASGRRSTRKADAAKADTGTTSPAAFLGLDPAYDPVFEDFGAAAAAGKAGKGDTASDGGLIPSTPPSEEELASALAFPCEEAFAEALGASLMRTDVDRWISEEISYRSYRMEYEASVISHQLAVQEQLAAAQNIGDLGLGDGFGAEPEEPDAFAVAGGGPKKATKRRKGGARTGGYLGLDDFADDDELGGAGTKRSASKAAFVEDVYLRKKRPTRTPAAFRGDADADYDLAAETGARYSTRRQTGALGRRGAAGVANDRNRRAAGGRAEAYQQQQSARARANAGMPGMMLWSKAEDDLLLAVVHEFGINWTLVSEALSLSLSMQGVHRPSQQCRQRFRQLTMQEGHDYSEERAYAALAAQMSKQAARELLISSLPVRDNDLVRLLEALVQVGASAATKRANEERRNDGLRTRRQDPHPSHMTILSTVMSQSAGRHLTPLELCATVNNAYMNQARMQQAQQQAAGAPGGGGAPPPGQPGAPGAPPPAAPPAGPPPGQPGVAQGTPAGPAPPQPGMPGAAPPAPGQPGAPPPQGVPGMAPGAPKHPAPQVTLQQLNSILATNRLPNGQELTDEMRKAIETKRAAFLQQIQAQQAAQQQAAQRQQAAAAAAAMAAGGAPPAGTPGQPGGTMPAAMAAMQASQHAAAMAAGARPAVPPGMYALPPGQGMPMGAVAGMPGMAMQLPQGAGMQMPPGLVLPPAQQQQFLAAQAQQQLAQQQAAAAAAAQQAATQQQTPK